jgi:hypothetical protein
VFRVAAVNDVGTGPLTAKTVAAVPATVPGNPTALVVTRGSGRATLGWQAPAFNGGSGLVDYRLQWSGDGGTTWRTVSRKPSTRTTATITGLPNGVPLVFRVAAMNAVGVGASVERASI